MFKRTKIVATIGPASVEKKILKEMVLAGLDVCRLNFSHGDYAWHKLAIKNIRQVEKEVRKKIGIMADLQGPRIRVANRQQLSVKEGQEVFLTDKEHQTRNNFLQEKKTKNRVIILDWPQFFQYLKTGDKVFIEDGVIQLEVEKVVDSGCLAKVIVGGTVKPQKAVNIPSVSNHLDFLTAKDKQDLQFALEEKVDIIAASFVGSAQDLQRLKKMIKQRQVDHEPWIIAKIEREKAIKNLEKIIQKANGVMIARGDLAIEMPQEEVALWELRILRLAQKRRKPSIVATQMLASMEENRRPTRAEIIDVSNAVLQGADAVMLSGETALGKYPVETVATMSKIIQTVENSPEAERQWRLLSFSFKKMGLGKKYHKQVCYRTARDLKELLKLSSTRDKCLRLRLSKRLFTEWGKAALVWGVDVRY